MRANEWHKDIARLRRNFCSALLWAPNLCLGEYTTLSCNVSSSVYDAAITDPDHPCFGARGLFASASIPAGSVLCTYAGSVQYAIGVNQYCALLDDRLGLVVDAQFLGNPGRFANDARGIQKTANAVIRRWRCSVTGSLFLVLQSTTDIEKDAEILLNYGQGYWARDAGQFQDRKRKRSDMYFFRCVVEPVLNGVPSPPPTPPTRLLPESLRIRHMPEGAGPSLSAVPLLQKPRGEAAFYGGLVWRVPCDVQRALHKYVSMRAVEFGWVGGNECGVFARRQLQRLDLIGVYSGVVTRYTADVEGPVVLLPNGLCISNCLNEAKFIRCSCQGNATLVPAYMQHLGHFYMAIRASRDIEDGTEICWGVDELGM
eukprot:EG_transcript_16626